jgi:glycosyltransferase involved in cell wall biosynthesis
MPEIIDDGRTGFIVTDVDGAVAASNAVAALDRDAIRAVAVERFDVSRMIAKYVEVYRSMLRRPAG